MEQSQLLYSNLNELQSDLSGHEIAYGSTYSIGDIRKAVIDGNFAFAEVGRRVLNFVGENKDSLIVQKGTDLYEISDNSLMKAWSGNAVIVLGETENSVCEKENMVIFASDRDTWVNIDNEFLSRARNSIQQISDISEEKIPDHPVVVMFKEPTEKETTEGIRAMTNGAEITIFDSSDPVTEFGHELGHVYWSRLNEDEKKRFELLHQKIKHGNMPAIFMTKSSHVTVEEMFCTIYQWFIKGCVLDSGYNKILEKQYPEGFALLEDVFRRILEEKQDLILKNTQFQKTQKEWSDNEAQICLWLNQAENKPSNIKMGNRMIKSKLPLNHGIRSYVFPEIEHDVLNTFKGREWVQINDGLLKGKVVVLNKGRLDIEYMSNNSGKVPTTKQFKRSGKTYNRTVWLKPDLFKAFMLEKEHKELVTTHSSVQLTKLTKWEMFKNRFGKK